MMEVVSKEDSDVISFKFLINSKSVLGSKVISLLV